MRRDVMRWEYAPREAHRFEREVDLACVSVDGARRGFQASGMAHMAVVARGCVLEGAKKPRSHCRSTACWDKEPVRHLEDAGCSRRWVENLRI